MTLTSGPTRRAENANPYPAAGYLTHLKFWSDRQALDRGVVESAGCSTIIHTLYPSLLQYTHAAFGERIRLPHLPATRALTFIPQRWLPK